MHDPNAHSLRKPSIDADFRHREGASGCRDESQVSPCRVWRIDWAQQYRSYDESLNTLSLHNQHFTFMVVTGGEDESSSEQYCRCARRGRVYGTARSHPLRYQWVVAIELFAPIRARLLWELVSDNKARCASSVLVAEFFLQSRYLETVCLLLDGV